MKPEIFWQLKKCIEGMRNAALKFVTPVTGGNVSLYNENPKGAIYPTPTVGMVGMLDDLSKRVQSFFKNAGNRVYLLGEPLNELGGSHYLIVEHGLKTGLPPRLDLDKEFALHQFLIACADDRLVESFHDLSEGGFAVALAECCFMSGLGVTVSGVKKYVKTRGIRMDAFLFGETQSRVIASVSNAKAKQFEACAKELNVPCLELGAVEGDTIKIEGLFEVPVSELKELYESVLPKALGAL
jgi:phosphoribosylformylglycinamidine synthase